MSLNDRIVQSSFAPQKAIHADPIFFQDQEGNYTIETLGIFKSEFVIVDSITQQDTVSDVPTIWLSRPTVVPIYQGIRLYHLGKYYQVKEVHIDVDMNAQNLLLHEIAAPEVD